MIFKHANRVRKGNALGKLLGERQLGRLRRRYENNVKLDSRNVGWWKWYEARLRKFPTVT
jgi:hypothetical protein